MEKFFQWLGQEISRFDEWDDVYKILDKNFKYGIEDNHYILEELPTREQWKKLIINNNIINNFVNNKYYLYNDIMYS